jgi:hypothetical protein
LSFIENKPDSLVKIGNINSGAGLLTRLSDNSWGLIGFNLGANLPADANNSTNALTSFGFNVVANDTTIVGGNILQKAVVNAFEQAFTSDVTAQSAVAAALAGNTTAMASLVSAFPVASDTVKGISSLAVAANYPSTSDIETTTPAYVQAALVAERAALKDVFGN